MLPSVFEYLLQAALIVVTVLYYDRVLEPNRPFVQMLVIVGLVLAGIQVLHECDPSLNFLSSQALPVVSILVAVGEALLLILALKAATGRGWMRIVLFYSLSVLIKVLSSLLPFALFGLFTGESVPSLVASRWNDFLISLTSLVLQMALLIAAGELTERYLNRQKAELRWSQFAPVLGAQAVSLIFSAVLPGRGEMPGASWTALSVLLVIYGVADIVLIQAFRAFVRNSELTRSIDSLTMQRQQQKAYYLSLNEQLKTARRLRHDYRNTLDTIHTLLLRGDVEKAEALTNECRTALHSGTPSLYTGNDILDAVLNNKTQTAQRQGIGFEVELVMPSPLPVSDMDLMSLFANLLDNAIEYLQQVPGTLSKRIIVNGKVRAGYWVLTFSNTFVGDTLPDFFTTKQDKSQHGMGRGIVRDIAQKYDGTVMAHVTEGFLTISVTLNIAG